MAEVQFLPKLGEVAQRAGGVCDNTLVGNCLLLTHAPALRAPPLRGKLANTLILWLFYTKPTLNHRRAAKANKIISVCIWHATETRQGRVGFKDDLQINSPSNASILTTKSVVKGTVPLTTPNYYHKLYLTNKHKHAQDRPAQPQYR